MGLRYEVKVTLGLNKRMRLSRFLQIERRCRYLKFKKKKKNRIESEENHQCNQCKFGVL